MELGRLLALSIFFLCLSGAVHAVPNWANITTEPEIHPFYQNRTYYFNATWTSSLSIDRVSIEHNFSGTLTNYTMTKFGNVYSYNSTNISSGYFQWRSFANDSSGTNLTDVQTYIVKKGHAFVDLRINGSADTTIEKNSNETINITVELFSANYTAMKNPDFELARANNASLPQNWFTCTVTNCQSDEVSWTKAGLSNDSYSGNKSLFFNATTNPYQIVSSVSKINNVSKRNFLELIVKPNISSALPVESGYGLYIEFEQTNSGFTTYNSYVFIINNTNVSIADTNNIKSVKYVDVENGWKKITAEYAFDTTLDLNYSAIMFYQNSPDVTGTILIDSISLKTFDERLNRTVFLNTSFPSWTAQNSSSPLINFTKAPDLFGDYNVTGNFSGDANYSFTNETHIVRIGLPTLLTVSVNQSSYQQGTNTSLKVYIPFQVNYTNATGSPVRGATCTITNNITTDKTTLTYDSTTNNYTCTGNACLDNFMLYSEVKFTASCSGNSTHQSSTNSTLANVSFQTYLWEFRNQSFGDTQNTTRWIRYATPSGAVINITKELSIATNSTDNDFVTFVLEDNFTQPNRSLDRTLTFSGNVTLRANLSLSNTMCAPKLCLQIQDKSLNALATFCGEKSNITASAPTFLEQNVTVNATVEVSNYLAFLVRCDANASLSTQNVNATAFYNYSSSPNIETRSAIPNPIRTSVLNRVQNEANYTVGPNAAVNSSWNETIQFNNSQSALRSILFYKAQSIITNASRLINTTVKVFSSAKASISASFSNGIASWTSEKIAGNAVKNETLQYSVRDAISSKEELLFQRIGESVWTVNISSIFVPQVSVRNVTAYTDYTTYGALAGWTFRINITNASGTFDISNQSGISGNILTFPATNLSSVLYRINATGLANGVACSADNQCGTGVCCSNFCASACVTTKVVSTGGGGGGSVVLEAAGMSVSAAGQTEAILGANGTLYINISNTIKDSVLRNVSLIVKGYLPGFILVTPEKIDEIKFNETKFFLVTLAAPIFLTEREYALDIITIANFTRQGEIRNLTKVLSTRLIVNPLLEKPPAELLIDTGRAIEDIANAGFGVNRATSLFSELQKAIDKKELAKADAIAKQINEIKQKAFSVAALINETKRKIEEARTNGLDITATQRFLDLAIEAFAREDYEKAEQRLNSAALSYTAETTGKINLIAFARNNWSWLSIVSVVLFFAGNSAYRKVTFFLINRTLLALGREEKVVRDMIAQQRIDYFQKRLVSRSEYHRTMYNLDKRLRKIRTKNSKLISKRAGIVGVENELQTLLRERDYTIEAIKELQINYFEKRSILKIDYSNNLQSYKLRLSDLEERKELLKLKKKGRIRALIDKALNSYYKVESALINSIKSIRYLKIIIIFIFISMVFAANVTDAENALNIAEKQINQMSSAGFTVRSVNDTLNRAKTLFLRADYDSVLILTKQINLTRTQAFDISSMIESADNKIYELSKMANVSALRSLLNNATVAFYKEDYLAAKDYAGKAFNAADELEGKIAIAKAEGEDFATAIRKNILLIIFIIALSSISAKLLYTKHKIIWRKNRLIFLEQNGRLINNLIKETQKNYFLQKTLSNYEYKMKINAYNRKLQQIRRETALLKGEVRHK